MGCCAGLPGEQNRGALSSTALRIGFPLPATAQTQSKSLSLQSQGFEAVMNEGFYPKLVAYPPRRLMPVPGLAWEDGWRRSERLGWGKKAQYSPTAMPPRPREGDTSWGLEE